MKIGNNNELLTFEDMMDILRFQNLVVAVKDNIITHEEFRAICRERAQCASKKQLF